MGSLLFFEPFIFVYISTILILTLLEAVFTSSQRWSLLEYCLAFVYALLLLIDHETLGVDTIH